MRRIRPIHVLSCTVSLIPFSGPLTAQELQPDPHGETPKCHGSRIRFDITSLEKVVLHPESILEDIDAFWREDGAYRLMSVWHEMNAQPRNIEDWMRRIDGYTQVPVGERSENSLLALGRELKKSEADFNRKAVTHVCSFLPPELKPIETTVYLAAEQMTSGIAVQGQIVLNIRNQDILNLIVHETYHIGFDSARGNTRSIDRENDPIGWIAMGLQYEGMATYVAFRALDLFPAPEFGDYQMLTDADTRKRLHRRLNSLFAKAPKYDPERLQRTAWRIGVQERAYYIVGAHMAETIDKELGREALIGTITEGPRSFIDRYNASVAEDLKIVTGSGI